MDKSVIGCGLLLLWAAGCGRSGTSVDGTVTFDGREIEKGFITFFPAAGTSNTSGAEIINGKFRISEITPGKKKVVIAAAPVSQLKDGKVRLLPPTIPADTPGNNQLIDVVPGSQVHHFKLGKAKS